MVSQIELNECFKSGFLTEAEMKVIIMCGIPGSGKSTRASEFGLPIVGFDAIRGRLWGDEDVQGDFNQIWREFNAEVFDLITKGSPGFVIDNTSTRRSDRVKMVKKFRALGVDKILLCYINTPFEIAAARNAWRDRSVPIEVLERMQHRLDDHAPNWGDEGFDGTC